MVDKKKITLLSKKAEEMLQNNEKKYRMRFENARDAAYLFPVKNNKPLHFVEANHRACKMLGYSRKELVRLTPLDINTEKHPKHVAQLIKNVRKNKYATFKTIHLSKKGTEIPVELSSHYFKIGKQEFILALARKITERKKTKKALHKPVVFNRK
ncbi:MAG: PAS domain S-box protein [Candidatus Micrarchaeota archaeon]